MRRRLFFRALLGAPVIGAAAAVPAKPEPVLARGHVPMCECGYQFVVREFAEIGPDAKFMECLNRRCKQHGIAWRIPQVSLAPADPLTVAVVRKESARLAAEWEAKLDALNEGRYECPRPGSVVRLRHDQFADPSTWVLTQARS